MRARSIRRFWDARAREDPFFFVDNRLRYGDPDLERFWSGGEELLDAGLERLGVPIHGGDEAVEIGCGLGRLTRPLARRARSVRALDVSPQMLERARELNRDLANVEWVLGTGDSLEGIASASADVCYSDLVFQHIPDPAVTLAYVGEMARVLRPGGWAGFQVSTVPSLHRRPPPRARVRQLVRSALGRGPRGQSHPAWLGSSIDLETLRRAAADAGLVTERVVGEGTQFCHVLLRRPGPAR
jgi:SAM-dependent methyltransferase